MAAPSRSRRSRAAFRLLAGLGCGLAASACAPAAGRAPDVVLVVLDTVRADHTSLHGYRRTTTPRLDALAQRATVFPRAHATAPWTLPAHASLFTGRTPAEHGAHRVAVPGPDEVGIRPLDARRRTLAEALRDRGYATAGFAANEAFLAPRYGLGRGFDEWSVALEPGWKVADRAVRWLDERADEPVFLFLNVMDAHRPYNVSRRDVDPAWTARRAPGSVALLERAVLSGEPLDRALRDEVIDQYDLGVANADAALGRLLRALEERGRLADAVVIVTSDHGEQFGEHGLALHGRGVQEAALHVPLVVKAPGQETERRDPRRVSSADVPALLLEAVPSLGALRGVFPRTPGSGATLAQVHFGNLGDVKEPWAARFREHWTAVYRGDQKLLLSTTGTHRLHDLARDPDEQDDLAPTHPGLVAEMMRALDERWARLDHPGAPDGSGGGAGSEPAPLDEETRGRLEALGYL